MKNSNKSDDVYRKVKNAVAAAIAFCLFFNITADAVAQAVNNPIPGTSGYGWNVSQNTNKNSMLASLNNLGIDAEKASVNLSFMMIPNTLSYDAVKKEAKTWFPFELDEEDYEEVFFQYKKAVVSHDYAITEAAKQVKRLFPINKNGMYSHVLSRKQGDKFCFPKDNSRHYAPGKEEVDCYGVEIFGQGMIRELINDATGVEFGPKSKFYWDTDILLARSPDLLSLIQDFGVNSKDTVLLQKYYRQILESGSKYCDNDIYKADVLKGFATGNQRADASVGKERRAKECEKLGTAIVGLSLLDVSNNEKNYNAEQIYKLLKKSYMDDYGAIVLYNSAAALVLIGNDKSYAYLDTFLFNDSFADGLSKGSFWQALGGVFDIISVNAWGNKITDVSNRTQGRAGRFQNRVSERFTYIDTDAALDMGFTHFQMTVARDNRNLYNMPYRNILEDIGVMLAQTNDRRAKALATKAVTKYANSIKAHNFKPNMVVPSASIIEELKTANKYVHVPLAIGALSGGASADANLLKEVYNSDWWDLNEGTQRRVNNAVAAAATAKGISGLPKRSVDESKQRRANINSKVATATLWTDIFIGAVLLTQLIASIPSIVKSIHTMARVINIRAAGKAQLLKSVSANLKAQGLTSQTIRLARYEKVVARNEAAKTAAQQQNAAATQRVTAQVKATPKQEVINPKDVEVVNTGNGTAEIRFKWQAQQPKVDLSSRYMQQNLTVSIGEGGGGASASTTGGAAQSAGSVNQANTANVAAKVRTTLAGPNNPATFKPVSTRAPATPVSEARILKAVRASRWDGFKDITAQIARNLRTRTGATLMAMNLSLLNPTTLTAAKAANGFNLSARGAGLTTELVSGGGGFLRSGLGGSSAYYAPARAVSEVKTVTNVAKVLPVNTPAAIPAFKPFSNPAGLYNRVNFPKYGYLNIAATQNISLTPATALVAKADEVKGLPEGWSLVSEEKKIPSYLAQTHATVGLPEGLPLGDPFSVQQAGFDPFFIIPLIGAGVLAKRFISRSNGSHNQNNIRPNTGMPWSNIRAPKGSGLKENVPVSYINSLGQEVTLPLTFNIDKGIKVKDNQRTVFNENNRLELRNGAKKPSKIEGFMMLLNGDPKVRLAFIDAIRLSGVENFKLKIQTTDNKQSRFMKSHDIYAADMTTPLPVSLQTPRDLVAENEILSLDAEGNFVATAEDGTARILNNTTFRVPKSEIDKLIQVLEGTTTPFALDVRPTQNKVLPFLLAFFTATTIMAAAPAFKEIFELSNFWATTLMGLISFGPAAAVPFLGYAYKKWGMVNVMRASTVLTAAGFALAALSGLHGYGTPGTNIPALIGATLGLSAVSLANEIKFSTMSPLFDVNFDAQKALSVTSYSLMARSAGTIAFMNFPFIFNSIAGQFGLAAADRTIAFSALLLPLASYAAASMIKAKLRDAGGVAESNITPKSLIQTYLSSPITRRGSTAFILFESFEATMSLLVFDLAKSAFPALDDVANFVGGLVVYGSMAASRLLAGKLQEKDILDAKKTYIASAIASVAGGIAFALGGFSPVGIVGAVMAFFGVSNFFGPLFNATKTRHPDKAGEISLIFFTTTTLASLSTMVLGAVMDATTSQLVWFAVPLASILTALGLSSYAITDIPAVRNALKKIGINLKDPTAPADTKAEVKDSEQEGPDMNNPLPN